MQEQIRDESTNQNPKYYTIPNAISIKTQEPLTIFDIIDDMPWNFNEGCIFKYAYRHGCKPNTPALKDLIKLRNVVNREIARLELLSTDIS